MTELQTSTFSQCCDLYVIKIESSLLTQPISIITTSVPWTTKSRHGPINKQQHDWQRRYLVQENASMSILVSYVCLRKISLNPMRMWTMLFSLSTASIHIYLHWTNTLVMYGFSYASQKVSSHRKNISFSHNLWPQRGVLHSL